MGRSCYTLGDNKATGCVPYSASKSKLGRTSIPGFGPPCHPGFCGSGLPHPEGSWGPPRDWGNPIRPPPWEHPTRASDTDKPAAPPNINGTACFCQSDQLCNGVWIKVAHTEVNTPTAAGSSLQISDLHNFIVIICVLAMAALITLSAASHD